MRVQDRTEKRLLRRTLSGIAEAVFLLTMTAAGVSAADDGRTLTVVYHDYGNNDVIRQWFERSYETFARKEEFQLNIVPVTTSESDYTITVARSLQSPDTAPDLFCEDTCLLPGDVEKGYLADLSGYLLDWEDWSNGNIYGALADGVTYPDGSVYAVPFNTDTRGLWYNKDIFEMARIPLPWQPESWQNILDTCAIIRERCPDVLPFWCNSGVSTGEATSMQTFEMLLYGTGEQLMDADGKWNVSGEGILRSLQFLADIYGNDFGPSLTDVLNGEAGTISARDYLPNSKLAILLDGSWITGDYKADGAAPWKNYEQHLGFAPMPTSDAQEPGRVTMSGGWALAVSEYSEEKELAVDFIRHCMSFDLYKDFIIAQGNLSTRADVTVDPDYAAQPYVKQCTQLLSEAFYRPWDSRYSLISPYIQQMVEAVVCGTAPSDAIEQYKANVTGIVGADAIR